MRFPLQVGVAALALLFVFVGRTRRSLAMRDVARPMVFVSLYRRVMVSSTDLENSLTVDGAASSHYALAVMTVVAVVFVPIVLLYQDWASYVFRRRVGGERAERVG